MGMYDTFLDKKAKITCSCGEINTFESGVQSKSFDKILNTYYVGDYVDSEYSYTYCDEYDICPKCKNKISLFLAFKQCIFIGIYGSREEALKASNNFDVYECFKNTFLKYSDYKKQINELKFRIKATIKFNTIEPNSNMFHPLFNFHHEFLDYDIITTLKNILDDIEEESEDDDG